MGFRISGLIPKYFLPHPDSQIWNNNFHLESGNKYLIYAPSGKGKSSFFKMLAGISKDYSGEIIFNDSVLSNSSADQLADFRSKHWSLMFQNLGLFPELSLKENLNITGNYEDCQINLKDLSLTGKENQKAHQLSYGERQRLAIIKALNKPYDFLIMDEPFSHLDKQLKEKTMNLILDDVDSKKATLIIFDLGDEMLYKDFQKLRL